MGARNVLRPTPHLSYYTVGRCSGIEEPAFDIGTKCDNESPDLLSSLGLGSFAMSALAKESSTQSARTQNHEPVSSKYFEHGGSPDRGETGTDKYGTTRRGLKSRHIQLIALGGCIGTGLFVGTGSTLSLVGPAPLFMGTYSLGFLHAPRQNLPISCRLCCYIGRRMDCDAGIGGNGGLPVPFVFTLNKRKNDFSIDNLYSCTGIFNCILCQPLL